MRKRLHHIYEPDLTSSLKENGKRTFRFFSLVSFLWKNKHHVDRECTNRERGEATHIPQESNSTSVLTGKNCRERERQSRILTITLLPYPVLAVLLGKNICTVQRRERREKQRRERRDKIQWVPDVSLLSSSYYYNKSTGMGTG
jgi:hypothetical protein